MLTKTVTFTLPPQYKTEILDSVNNEKGQFTLIEAIDKTLKKKLQQRLLHISEGQNNKSFDLDTLIEKIKKETQSAPNYGTCEFSLEKKNINKHLWAILLTKFLPEKHSITTYITIKNNYFYIFALTNIEGEDTIAQTDVLSVVESVQFLK